MYTSVTAREAQYKRHGLVGKFICSVVPIKGRYKMTLCYRGKEFVFVGKDRKVLINNMAQNLIKALN